MNISIILYFYYAFYSASREKVNILSLNFISIRYNIYIFRFNSSIFTLVLASVSRESIRKKVKRSSDPNYIIL